MHVCEQCGGSFGARAGARFCSDRCRKARRRYEPLPLVVGSDLERSVVAELSRLGMAGSYLAGLAVKLARLMVSAPSGPGYPALSRELKAVMADAARDAGRLPVPPDELARRRRGRRG